MNKIGLFDYIRQAGKVNLHEQGTLSNSRYEELKSAQKMIKSFIKNSDCRVDIYDAQTVPADKFVYTKRPDSVYVEMTDLLCNKTKSEEFYDKPGESFIRQIFKFIDKASGVEEPIEKMKSLQRTKVHKLIMHKPLEFDKVI